jgi:hypothetical protein
MQITDEQLEICALAAFGRQATQLLCAANFAELADQFGYVFAFGRDPALAIQEELKTSLAELGASGLVLPQRYEPSVSYFQVNSSGLLALVEQRVPTENGRYVLVELIVRGTGSDKHIEMEEISAVI